jgi:hypothetical protein
VAKEFYDESDWVDARAGIRHWICPLRDEGGRLYLWRLLNWKWVFCSPDRYEVHLNGKLTNLYGGGV